MSDELPQPDHRDTLALARHVLECRWMLHMPAVMDIARALLAKELECEQVRKERDDWEKRAREIEPQPFTEGLYLSIQDVVYRAEVLRNYAADSVKKIVRLMKLAGDGDVYHVVHYKDDSASCECGSWTFKLNQELTDHRMPASLCKHIRACRDSNLIHLPVASVVTRRPVPEGEAT